ncbi:MAG: hypothetical protein IJ692_04440 [Alloprevotella sp.]|nr:hypothetical protein [Alloprevotella sp.]MBR1645099.1 hypothetical protein [Bacteroidales bacterium]MBR1652621.1 hypothetical protein [Alloprevotella sp.]
MKKPRPWFLETTAVGDGREGIAPGVSPKDFRGKRGDFRETLGFEKCFQYLCSRETHY